MSRFDHSLEGRLILVRGKKCRVVEPASNFATPSHPRWWVQARERVGRYQPGEQFVLSQRAIKRNLP